MSKENESIAREIQKVSPVLRSIGALLIFMFRSEFDVPGAYECADGFIDQLIKDVSE